MDQPFPSDPMWATFRREHPEVTLVLLPDEAPAATTDTASLDEASDAAESSSEAEPPAEAEVTLDEAQACADALTRRVALIAQILQVDTAPVPGWRGIGTAVVEPQASLRAPATESTPTDRELISLRLQQLGWKPEVRPESEVVWVDATAAEGFVRVTIFDGFVSVRATGDQLNVGALAAQELRGGHDA